MTEGGVDGSSDRRIGRFCHRESLDILARSDAQSLKRIAEDLLPRLGGIEVLSNRTGLAMLPYSDTVQGTTFHVGEVLVAEAHIKLSKSGIEGYGVTLGYDLQRAMAVATVDAAIAARIDTAAILDFLEAEDRRLAAADDERLRKVEATRVQMETF